MVSKVEIFDGATLIGTAEVDADKHWSVELSELSYREHNLNAKAGAAAVSNHWRLTCEDPFTQLMVLDGLMIVDTRRPVFTPQPGTSQTRTATWGTAPYSYSTDNPHIVRVDAVTGTVISLANGAAIVSAEDSAGGKRSYPVSVSNCYTAHYGSFRLRYHAAAISEAQKWGGRLLSQAELISYLAAYNGYPEWSEEWTRNEEWVWTTTIGGDGNWGVLSTKNATTWATLGESGWGCVVFIREYHAARGLESQASLSTLIEKGG